MNNSLQLPLLLISIIVLIIVLLSVIKNHLNIGYAMVWILWALGMIVISLFPNLVLFFGNLLGIQVASNAIFLVTIFLLYCLTFYLYLRISKHNEEITILNYEIASLNKKLEELNNEKVKRKNTK